MADFQGHVWERERKIPQRKKDTGARKSAECKGVCGEVVGRAIFITRRMAMLPLS
jgi:hypothetical protein